MKTRRAEAGASRETPAQGAPGPAPAGGVPASETGARAEALRKALRALSLPERKLVMLAYSSAADAGEGSPPRKHPRKALADLLHMDREKLPQRLEQLGRKLLSRSLVLPQGGGAWLMTGWLSSIELDDEGLGLGIQPAIGREWLEVGGQDAIVPMAASMQLKGKYSHGLLGLLLEARPRGRSVRSWELELEVQELRDRLALDDRYPKAKALKKWVIADAVGEINLAELGLRVEVETKLSGKKTRGFLFSVRSRKSGAL